MPQVRIRKILTLLDSSGNNPVVAKRITSNEGNENRLEYQSEHVPNAKYLENQSVDVRIAKNLENQSPARPFDKNLECRTDTKNDRKTIKKVRKIE